MACQTLSLEDHILYLCFHAAIHHKFVYVGPRALLDIACVINRPPREIDWSAFVDRSNEFQWSRGVWLTLDLIRENLGVSPPEFVLTELAPSDLPSPEIRENVVEALFLDQFHYDKLTPNVINFIDASALVKIQILYARIFPSKIEIATEFGIPVQSRWFFLNYIRRLLRLVCLHGPRIFQIIIKSSVRVSEKERSVGISNWLG